MISIKSLSENLLPNLYLKKVTLDTIQIPVTNPLTKNIGYGVPEGEKVNKTELQPSEDLAFSNVSLSIKFPKSPNFRNEIVKLFDLGLAHEVKIYMHQFQDSAGNAVAKTRYENILSNPEASKEALTTKYNTTTIKTKTFTLDEIWQPQYSSMFSPNSKPLDNANFSEQTLQDGTKIFEVLINGNFIINKNASFLAYIFVATIESELFGGSEAAKNLDDTFISKPGSEIVILDNKVQNEGVMFTIAPYPSNITNAQRKQLESFGKPGDIWAGGVHLQQTEDGVSRFMAGTAHTPNSQHPFLDYSIVPLNKFIDNRIKDKFESSPIAYFVHSITDAFDKLNTGLERTKYLNSANPLNFVNYKPTAYVSDFWLSQDAIGNVNGSFAIDKLKLLERKSAFGFLLEKAAVKPEWESYVVGLSRLENLSLYERIFEDSKDKFGSEKLIAGPVTYINEPEKEVFFGLDDKNQIKRVSKSSSNIESALFLNNFETLIGVVAPDYTASEIGIKHHSFKRIVKSGTGKKLQYSISVSYSDPTIEVVKTIVSKIRDVLKDLDAVTTMPLPNRPIGVSSVADLAPVESNNLLTSVKNLMDDIGFKIFIYDPGYDFLDFEDYLRALGTINYFDYANNLTTRREINKNFLTLTSFLRNLDQSLTLTLDNFGSKSLNSLDGTAESNKYAAAQSEVFTVTPPEPKIYFKSKQNEITIYDHGYDFTGYLKKMGLGNGLTTSVRNEFKKFGIPENIPPRREQHSLPTISTTTYKRMCEYLYFQLTPAAKPIAQKYASLNDLSFFALGIDGQITPKSLAYSYLNIPEKFLRHCVHLPETVINKQKLYGSEFNATPGLRTQILFFNIIKYKNAILEDNLNTIAVQGSRFVSLQEDLMSVLNYFGLRVPQLMDVDYTKDLTFAPSAPGDAGGGSFASLQESSFEDAVSLESVLDPAIDQSKANTGGKVGSKQLIGASNSQFVNQTNTTQTNILAKFNFFLASLVDRRLFRPQDTFNLYLSTFNNNFIPWSEEDGGKSEYDNYHRSVNAPTGGIIIKPPLQSLSLSVNSNGFNPFKNFKGGNLSYIKNGTINPFLLSLFWFNHQNIMKVEYLSGYHGSSSNPFNVKRPQWRTLDKSIIDSLDASPGEKLLCRLVRYDYPYYINKRLVSELNLPLMNNYFILESGNDTVDISDGPIGSEDPGEVPGVIQTI